jgi:hypothetical protein
VVGGEVIEPEAAVDDEGKLGAVAAFPLAGVDEADQVVELRALGVEGGGGLVGLRELAEADIVRAALGNGDRELLLVGLLKEGDILVEKLLLEGDGAGGDDGFLAAFEDGNQVAERLPAAGPGLDDGVAPVVESCLDQLGHFKLLGAMLVTGELAHHLPHDVLDHGGSGKDRTAVLPYKSTGPWGGCQEASAPNK